MDRRVRIALILTAVVVVGVGTFLATRTSTSLTVLGFQEGSDPTALIDRDARALADVTVDGVDLTKSGTGLYTRDGTLIALLRRAHGDRLRAFLLVGNWSGAIHGFSEPIAHRMLSSAANRRSVELALVQDVTTQGWDGINVDLEALNASDSAGLVAFVRELRAALPRAATLSIDLVNETSLGGMQADGYDLPAIGGAVNKVVLMAYDENGPWNPHTPGPIGALPWQRAGIAVLVSQLPASKVMLGVAGYGYAWRPSGAISVTDAQARALAAQYHVTPHWDPVAGEWTARLPDGSVIWWSDARSFAARRTLASQFHLAGLSVWNLASSDRLS